MASYLDFKDGGAQNGYEPMEPTRDNFKKNIGKHICVLTTRDVNTRRGIYFVRYYSIHSIVRNTIFIDDGHEQIEIKKIIECGIKIDANKNNS